MPVYAAGRMTCYYQGPLGSHRMSFWQTIGTTYTAFYAAVRAVVADLIDCQYSDTFWTNADYQAPGDNFSTPVTWSALQSPGTEVDPTQNDTVGEYLNFVGRSTTTGRRVRLFLFEVPFGPGRDMRLQPGESNFVDQAIAQLNNVGDEVGAIDGSPVVWKNYSNLGINDYWIRQARVSS